MGIMESLRLRLDAVERAVLAAFGRDNDGRGPGTPVLVPIPVRADRSR